MAEVTAIGVYVGYWFPDIPQWLPALAGVIIIALANLAAVKFYGEFEFWFAMIKIVAIIFMLIVGTGMIFFGLGNGGQPIGLSNLYSHGGFCRWFKRVSICALYCNGRLSRYRDGWHYGG